MKKVQKERTVNRNILTNMIYAMIMMIYFIFLIIGLKLVEEEILIKYIKISSMVLLLTTIVIFEKAYKEDSGKIAIYGIEFLILSIYVVLIEHMSNILKTDLTTYLAISAYAVTIYYVIKSMIIYTKYRKEQLDNLSDISEIVKEEPTKKEPTKREIQIEETTEEQQIKKKPTKKEKSKKEPTKKESTKKETIKKKTTKKEVKI